MIWTGNTRIWQFNYRIRYYLALFNALYIDLYWFSWEVRNIGSLYVIQYRYDMSRGLGCRHRPWTKMHWKPSKKCSSHGRFAEFFNLKRCLKHVEMCHECHECHETCCLVHDRYRSHLHLKNIKFGSIIWIFWFSVHIPFRSTGKTTETTENPGQRPRATSGHCSSAAFCVGCHWWWLQDAAGTSVGKDEARTGAAWLKKRYIAWNLQISSWLVF